MTKYQLIINSEKNHGNGYIDKDTVTYYSSYVVNLMRKFEDFKRSISYDYGISASLYKIENIRTMTLDEIGLHIHNDDDYVFIASFKDTGDLVET